MLLPALREDPILVTPSVTTHSGPPGGIHRKHNFFGGMDGQYARVWPRVLLLTSRGVFSPPHCLIRVRPPSAPTGPALWLPDQPHACQPRETFIFCFLPSLCSANHRSPPPPPPQRLGEAAPRVIGISLMKKGWCLSHYSRGE